MSDREIRTRMYGPSGSGSVVSPTTKPQTPNQGESNRIAFDDFGNRVMVTSDKQQLHLPSSSYVDQLEKRVKGLEKNSKRLNLENRRMAAIITNMSRTLAALQAEIKNKVDKF